MKARLPHPLLFTLLVHGAALLAACGTSTSPAPAEAGQAEAGQAEAGGLDAGLEASAQDSAEAGPSCTGDCAVTSLQAQYGTVKASFGRAQFGHDLQGGRVTSLTVEAHAGGSPECPKEDSPTPDRTLVVSGIPVGSQGRTLTFADGVRATLLDFKTVLTKKPLDRATSITLKVIALDGDLPRTVAFDLEATFEEGTIKGHAYATHCTSMDAK